MAHNSESVGTWVCGLRKAYRQAVSIFRHRVYPIDFENALRFQAGPLTETSLPFHGCRMYAYAPERASAFSPFIFGHLLLRVNRFRSSRRSRPLPACADEGVYPRGMAKVSLEQTPQRQRERRLVIQTVILWYGGGSFSETCKVCIVIIRTCEVSQPC